MKRIPSLIVFSLTLLLSIGLWFVFGGREALASEAGVKPEYGLMLRSFCLGAGFMLVEVALLQRFVLLLGHPVYSLTVTLFSLLLGTGAGSFFSRTFAADQVRRRLVRALLGIIVVAGIGILVLPPLITAVIQTPRAARVVLAILILVPAGALMGIPLPAGVRLLSAGQPSLVPWAWGMNGALSVMGATLAVFIAMNWGFSVTLATGALVYLLAAALVARA